MAECRASTLEGAGTAVCCQLSAVFQTVAQAGLQGINELAMSGPAFVQGGQLPPGG